MPRVMPSQVVETIDDLFPHAARGVGGGTLQASHSSQLLGILNLINAIPDELINLPSVEYSELILAISTIESHLETWISRGSTGHMANVKGRDVVTVLRRILAKCKDEQPSSVTTELIFITDDSLRQSIRSDLGAAHRALNNAEWKAATVLAGATIEALLYWKLESSDPIVVQKSVDLLVAEKAFIRPRQSMERWDLHHFIEIAENLHAIKPETACAARLAQAFRNLIHPGRAIRLNQSCDRATAHTAIGALEHVIRDLS